MSNTRFYMYLVFDYEDNKLMDSKNHCGSPYADNQINDLNKLPGSLKEYHELNNGFGITWKSKKDETIFGGFKFIPVEEIFENYYGQLYFEDDLEKDPLIDKFRPFDELSPEIRCGFIDHPDENIASIYMHNINNEYGLVNLDINIDGYVELMKMCWAYNNWPYILLYLKEDDKSNVSSYSKSLVEAFKRDMPKVVKGFSWDKFVDTYKSLRISQK